MMKTIVTILCVLFCLVTAQAQSQRRMQILVFDNRDSAKEFRIELEGKQFTEPGKNEWVIITKEGKRSFEPRIRKLTEDIASLPYMSDVMTADNTMWIKMNDAENKAHRIKQVVDMVEGSLCTNFDTYVSAESYMIRYREDKEIVRSQKELTSYGTEEVMISYSYDLNSAAYVPPKPDQKVIVNCNKPECH